jgi:hypothetical protein
MKYAVEIGSGALINVHTKFHEDWFGYSEVSFPPPPPNSGCKENIKNISDICQP